MLPYPFDEALVLTGPTASGKTELGLRIAESCGAEILSMDSMCLYRGMDIGTAKPTKAEQARVRHHLIDCLEPHETTNVAWWLAQASEAARHIRENGKRVLLVGGTPLYLKALLCGLFEGPGESPEIRSKLEREETQALYERLKMVDCEISRRIHENDRRRIIRALEVWEITGTPLSSLQSQWFSNQRNQLAYEQRIFWIDLPRTILYERINERVKYMFELGLLDEVRALQSRPLGLSKTASQALGYKEVLTHLRNETDLRSTMSTIQTRSRQFAKRQVTWFRHLSGCLPANQRLTFSPWSLKIDF